MLGRLGGGGGGRRGCVQRWRSCAVGAVDLGLAVGERGGDPVDEEPDPADAEARARSEPTDGDPQILGEVVPVEEDDARDAAERLFEGNLRLRETRHWWRSLASSGGTG